MNHFTRDATSGNLTAEGLDLHTIADSVGTPAYIYSAATFVHHYKVFDEAWNGVPHRVCFAVKACSNIAVLQLLAAEGAGFDIVSGGELHRVLTAGGDPKNVVFSGVGKSRTEMAEALRAGIHCFNVESVPELDILNEVAEGLGLQAPISLRVNPDVNAQTHPYISTGLRTSKFGIAWDMALDAYAHAESLSNLQVVGVDCHIGSQLSNLKPMAEALRRILTLVDALEERGILLRHIDLGGGLGIRYKDETPPSPLEYANALRPLLAGRNLEVILEPGRVISGNAGLLLTRVVLVKDNGLKRFVVVDAAMNDSIRPALYNAHHGFEPVGPARDGMETVDIVGPICESSDFLAKDRTLPTLEAGDLVAMRSAGAYGFSMSSTYNSRPRAVEVLVKDGVAHTIRDREKNRDLIRGEHLLPIG